MHGGLITNETPLFVSAIVPNNEVADSDALISELITPFTVSEPEPATSSY